MRSDATSRLSEGVCDHLDEAADAGGDHPDVVEIPIEEERQREPVGL